MESIFPTDKPIDQSTFSKELERLWIEKNCERSLIEWFLITQQKLEEGSVCIDLNQPITYRSIKGETVILPNVSESYIQGLKSSLYIGGENDFKPLILSERNRLYWHKYWKYEVELQAHLYNRIKDSNVSTHRSAPLVNNDTLTQEQQLSIWSALSNKITLITGGPGTGKTTVVARILLACTANQHDSSFKIALAAPTGKAAARMRESLNRECALLKDKLPTDFDFDTFYKNLPQESFTLHRLLGYLPFENVFKKDTENRLNQDWIIVDEATMIDLPLMVHFFRALPEKTRIVLIGDGDQLTSVGAGSVFADLVTRYETGAFPVATRQVFENDCRITFPQTNQGYGEENPQRTSVVRLTKTFRFAESSGIYAVCEAVRKGDVNQLKTILNVVHQYSDFVWHHFPKSSNALYSMLTTLLDTHYATLSLEIDALNALQLLKAYCVLTPMRKGYAGVEALNGFFKNRYGYQLGSSFHFAGMPIMITVNDYANGLYNGDVGIILKEATGELAAFFPDSSNGAKKIALNTLPAHQPAYAMTIHKSQGSEFDHAIVIIPNDTQMATRELIYTAISRGKKNVSLISNAFTLEHGVAKSTARASGL